MVHVCAFVRPPMLDKSMRHLICAESVYVCNLQTPRSAIAHSGEMFGLILTSVQTNPVFVLNRWDLPASVL